MPRPPRAQHDVPQWSRVLRARRTQLNKKQEELADESGGVLTQAAITDFENGRSRLDRTPAPKLLALARALQWTPGQLQRETGVPLGFPDRPSESDLGADYALVDVYDLEPGSGGVKFPLETRPVRQEDAKPGMRHYRMRGDPMEPTIRAGEDITCDTTQTDTAENGVFLLETPSGILVRRLRLLGAQWWMFCDNPRHAPEPIPRGAVLLGRVRPTIYPLPRTEPT